ncbi:heavy metal translocating P-type ATPase [Mucilaginibacter rubeus]|uniref:P-type Zn(2+) transporter n=2 Tax=Mucilaginibacter rubeus TaxID=2027860 RepID=A0AAE6MM06_9SPHI|nr:heavy metal translocating P-type ATPase [Mucilaginibacter rubeus]QTE47200.1 heavy metal translocating P-type ATPase [Mucilaginibacter rubeus]QTE53797.1 heavy metal translocating P-type ATPase [Mucilaginibacter rubeus]QTE60311.1 heavy metal translocating P-type ATPase [Mucilaginibacter rubeus]QTE66769.1 heavy metal translocating P-type ATPase [Mucilaginibacter rubeus]
MTSAVKGEPVKKTAGSSSDGIKKGKPEAKVPKDGHNHKEGDDHDEEEGHEHGGIFGKNTEMIFAAVCGAALGAGWGLTFVAGLPSWISLSLYIVAYFFGGFFTAREAVQTILKGGFEIDFLMLVAAIGAAILGSWAEGALLLFLFSLGHSLEHYAMAKARKSIAALTSLAPPTALVSREGKQEEISIEELILGDIIIIKPNSKIPADGVVVKGESSVNQAPITGESVPVDKSPVPDAAKDYSKEASIKPQYRVFAGTINGAAALEVKVIKEAKDSTISRLVKMVNEAEKHKSPTQLFTEKFEKFFVPAVLILVTALCFAYLVIDEPFSKSFYRAMSVLVAASPCALAISTPSAVLAGVARAARGGVLIKGGRPLEDLGSLNAIAFDKTGTLTEGKPQLTNAIPFDKITEEELLTVAVAVEKLSDHPLAEAIVNGAMEKLKKAHIPEAHHVKGITGRGVQAEVNGKKVLIGNKALFAKSIPDGILKQVEDLEKQGHTTMLVKREKDFIGLLSLMDVPRKEAKHVLAELSGLGIKKMIMLTGDNQQVADSVAKQIGITEAWGDLMPEDKVKAVQKLDRSEKMVAMIGDGVNDAPAMAKSTVGIAMGAAGSDVALETADIALMGDKLESLPFAIGLSRKAKGIIKQNLWISLGVVAALIPLTILGIASIGPAVIAHEGSTLLVVFNALRLLAYNNDQKNTAKAKSRKDA